MHNPAALLLDHLAAFAIHHATLNFHMALYAAQFGDTLDPTRELGQEAFAVQLELNECKVHGQMPANIPWPA